MAVKLVEVEPGRFRVKRKPARALRSSLSLPYVISDIMEPTEQVDGRFYTSKRAFRAVGRAHGLVEVGTEKFKPRKRVSANKEEKDARMRSIKAAIARFRAGERWNNAK